MEEASFARRTPPRVLRNITYATSTPPASADAALGDDDELEWTFAINGAK